jgi:hypothetical protein
MTFVKSAAELVITNATVSCTRQLHAENLVNGARKRIRNNACSIFFI